MKKQINPALAIAGALALGGIALGGQRLADASDHTDGPLATGDQAADIADVYSFRNGENLVLAMTISNVQASPQIALGQSILDPEVLYQFKIDADGDAIEDRVIQAVVTGTPSNQTLHVIGPTAPMVTGTTGRLASADATASVQVSTGTTAITETDGGLTIFAGVRDDPFFFDLGQFSAVLAGQASSFNDPGSDTFAGLNVYAIVVEVPLASLGDPANLSVWGTTSRR